jgi:hypothetical protein
VTDRLLREDCAGIKAEPRLTRAGELGADRRTRLVRCTVNWTDGTRQELALTAVATRQRRGERWWWRCPSCARRCGVLLSPGSDAPFACRRCWQVVWPAPPRVRRDGRRAGASCKRPTRTDVCGPVLQRQLAAVIMPRCRGARRRRRLERQRRGWSHGSLRLRARCARCSNAGPNRPGWGEAAPTRAANRPLQDEKSAMTDLSSKLSRHQCSQVRGVVA